MLQRLEAVWPWAFTDGDGNRLWCASRLRPRASRTAGSRWPAAGGAGRPRPWRRGPRRGEEIGAQQAQRGDHGSEQKQVPTGRAEDDRGSTGKRGLIVAGQRRSQQALGCELHSEAERGGYGQAAKHASRDRTGGIFELAAHGDARPRRRETGRAAASPSGQRRWREASRPSARIRAGTLPFRPPARRTDPVHAKHRGTTATDGGMETTMTGDRRARPTATAGWAAA